MKAAESAAGAEPARFHFGDAGGARPAPERREQHFERFALAFGDDFDGAIFLIAHPSGQAEVGGAALGEIAETDALDAPVNDGMKLFAHDLPFDSAGIVDQKRGRKS